jgi:hypothetical protein
MKQQWHGAALSVVVVTQEDLDYATQQVRGDAKGLLLEGHIMERSCIV